MLLLPPPPAVAAAAAALVPVSRLLSSPQAEKAVSERTKGVLDDPDRLAALAVAVASSEEPLETLETLCQAVLDGVDVEAALRSLLDKGKKDKRG